MSHSWEGCEAERDKRPSTWRHQKDEWSFTDTMVKMQRLEEEKDEFEKVIDEERSKKKELTTWCYDV